MDSKYLGTFVRLAVSKFKPFQGGAHVGPEAGEVHGVQRGAGHRRVARGLREAQLRGHAHELVRRRDAARAVGPEERDLVFPATVQTSKAAREKYRALSAAGRQFDILKNHTVTINHMNYIFF